MKLITMWPHPTPVVVALTEIRLSQEASLWEYQRKVWKASQGDWWFMISSEPNRKKWGVGLLVSSQILSGVGPPKN